MQDVVQATRAEPSRLRLLIEMIAIYAVAPLGAYGLVFKAGVPLLGVLVPVFLAFVLFLSLDKTFSWRTLFLAPVSRAELAGIATLFAVLGSVIVAIAYFLDPTRFLDLPRYSPGLWLALMVLYPLVSVTAQEIMYRVLFAHRYLKLFRGNFVLAIVANAALFAFSHLIFESWITIVVSFAGGLIFAYRYFTYRSFWGVCLEHALYGNLIFTVGLGRYFLIGVPFE